MTASSAARRASLRRSSTLTQLPPAYRRRYYSVLVGVLAAIAILAPVLAQSRSDKFVVNMWLLYSITGIGFYWIFGIAGRFAFCQTLMMALGAYTSAYIVGHLGPEAVPLGVLGGVLAAGVLAAVLGYATRNTKEFSFAIATLAATQIGMLFFREATWLTGPNGTVPKVDSPLLFGHQFRTEGDMFWLMLGALALTLTAGVFLERSAARRTALSARDNEMVSRCQGVATKRIQLSLLIAGSAVGGLSGALLAHWTGSVGADSFGLELAIGIFVIVLVGGTDSLWGPLIGAAFYVGVPEVFSGFEQYQTIIYGAILLLVVIVFPQGVTGGLRKLSTRVPRCRRRQVEAPS